MSEWVYGDGEKVTGLRLLDIEVAESLGWKVIETDDCNGIDNFWLSEAGQNVWTQDWYEVELPQYSVRSGETWSIITELEEKGFSLELYSPGALISDEFGTYSEGWTCRFMAWKNIMLGGGRAKGCETAQEAICRAAIDINNKSLPA